MYSFPFFPAKRSPQNETLTAEDAEDAEENQKRGKVTWGYFKRLFVNLCRQHSLRWIIGQ